MMGKSTLLVCGSAPCVYDDLVKALEMRPLAAVMLVNGACTLIENADHVLAGHTDKAELFAKERRRMFPDAPPWRLHATVTEKYKPEAEKVFPSVTDWWDKTYCTGATSIAKGALIGLRGLGFDEVILCGAPMDGSGYAVGEAQVGHEVHRVGDPFAQDRRAVKGYKDKYKKFAVQNLGRVFSMSGFTRECSGAPKEM